MVFCYLCNEGKQAFEKFEMPVREELDTMTIKRGTKVFDAPACVLHRRIGDEKRIMEEEENAI